MATMEATVDIMGVLADTMEVEDITEAMVAIITESAVLWLSQDTVTMADMEDTMEVTEDITEAMAAIITESVAPCLNPDMVIMAVTMVDTTEGTTADITEAMAAIITESVAPSLNPDMVIMVTMA